MDHKERCRQFMASYEDALSDQCYGSAKYDEVRADYGEEAIDIIKEIAASVEGANDANRLDP